MKYIYKFIITLFFLLSYGVNVLGQTDLDQFFKDRKYEKIIDILTKKEKSSKLSMEEYPLLARSYGRTEQYTNGLVYAHKLINLSLKNKDTSNLLVGYNLKTENLIDLERMKEGVEFCESIESTFRKQDSLEFQKLCFKWGMMYHYTKEHKKAYDIYNKITHSAYRNHSLFTTNYGVILIGLKRWEEALIYQRKSLALDIERKNTRDLSLTFSNISMILMNLNRFKEAKMNLDSATVRLSKRTPLYHKKSLFVNYSDYYKLQGSMNEAKAYLDSVRIINEKIFNNRINEKVASLEASYVKEDELNKELKTQQEELEASKRQKLYYLIAVLGSILILGGFLFQMRLNQIKTRHQTILTEQKLLRSQMTPHFIFNSLSIIQGMILNKEDKKASKYLSKFSRLMRLILENSRQKMVLITDEIKAVENYLDLQQMSSDETFNYTISIDDTVSEDVRIPPMLIQPFVENAIEHGFKNNIENRQIDIIKMSSFKKSLSTTITNERLEMLSKEFNTKANLVIKDRSENDEKGTRVIITIPHQTV